MLNQSASAELDLRGIFPPITTPFLDGEVAYDKLASNIEKWSATGLKGFVVLGSNGEYVSLSEAEKRKVVETVVQATPSGMTVMAGTGCESTRETIRLTQDCARLGARAALVVNPHYYGGRMTAAALITHYTQLADSSPIPILLYNVPKFTHITLAADVVAKLSEHPNIVGIKDSSGNVALIGEYLNNVAPGFKVLVGTASGILALANVAPEHCVRILNTFREGNIDEARNLQLTMLPVNQAVTATFGIPGLKSAMDMVGYFGGKPRSPLLPLSESETSRIKEILKKAELV